MGIQVGDMVQLKSGGPSMTVRTLKHDSFARCQWFDGQELRCGEFAPEGLALVVSKQEDRRYIPDPGSSGGTYHDQLGVTDRLTGERKAMKYGYYDRVKDEMLVPTNIHPKED